MGDPDGIGPEIIRNALRRMRRPPGVRLLVIGDRRLFPASMPAEVLACPAPRRSLAPLACLDQAIALARAGQIHAVVTAPITKWKIQRCRPSFQGHTEYLAQAFGVRDAVMMFASDRLRVALLTRHLALRSVSSAVTRRLVKATIAMTHQALRSRFGIAHPRLAICGVNPHAGELERSGVERCVIIPALRALRARRIVCDGPFAADGFFGSRGWHAYDAIISPYHDQGLIPFKMLARDQGCQVTLGLPIARTAPDHGSALDIAGRGIANPGSMAYAIHLACQLIQQKGDP